MADLGDFYKRIVNLPILDPAVFGSDLSTFPTDEDFEIPLGTFVAMDPGTQAESRFHRYPVIGSEESILHQLRATRDELDRTARELMYTQSKAIILAAQLDDLYTLAYELDRENATLKAQVGIDKPIVIRRR